MMEQYRKWKDVLSVVSGKNQKTVANPTGQYPIYGSGGIMGKADDFLCEAGTTIVGRKGTINNPIFVNERFWNVDTAFGISPGPLLTPKFLYYFCRSFNFKALDKSTTIPSLAKSDLLNIEMPVPSIPDQERIVVKIEELFSQLDSGVETLKKTKQQLEVYRQAVLKEAYCQCKEYVSLGTLCDRVFDGPFGSNLKTADYTEQGIRVVRLENIKNGWFDDTRQSFISPEKYETIQNHTVYPNDLIISTFIADSIKACQLPVHIDFAVNKADCVGVRLKPSVLPAFILYYLLTEKAYHSLAYQVHGATRPRVNTKQIKNMQVPIVDEHTQRKTISIIDEKLSVCDSIEQTIDAALQQAEALRQSILKKAFEG